MGGALCRGIIDAHIVEASKVVVSDIHADHVQSLQQTLGVRVAKGNEQLAKHCEVIVLALKPFTVASVLDEIRESLKRDEGKPLPLLISIAAGVRIETIQAHLDLPIPVVRAMPNTPALIGAGVTAAYAATAVAPEETAQAGQVLSTMGKLLWVKSEALLDPVTAVSGSGPAYVFYFIEALEQAARELGLEADAARTLALETFLGAARLAAGSSEDPATLRARVTSKGGTTEAALALMDSSQLKPAIVRAVHAANARALELGEQMGKDPA